MQPLKDLFLAELADRYDAEKRLVRALPKVARAATCTHLQKLVRSHLAETIGHVKKLETVFKSFGTKVKAKKCEATIGLLKEGDEIAAEFKDSPALNAALISVAQKVEHYEIASYGCLREWAGLLGQQTASLVLNGILVEERAMNQKLIALARSRSNSEALGECNGAASRGHARSVMPLAMRRAMRLPKLHRSRPVLM